MEKQVSRITLHGVPPLLNAVFNHLAAAGTTHFALFGGAVRDADYAARHQCDRPINDYDLRVWLADEAVDDFVRKLGPDVREEPSAGTGRIRYCLNFMGAALDISIRSMPSGSPTPAAVAIDRAGDADIGLCSVALDPHGQAWATAEYVQDRDNTTLTVYPLADLARKDAYTKRMQAKFPAHRVVNL